jgi:hypothetical protein
MSDSYLEELQKLDELIGEVAESVAMHSMALNEEIQILAELQQLRYELINGPKERPQPGPPSLAAEVVRLREENAAVLAQNQVTRITSERVHAAALRTLRRAQEQQKIRAAPLRTAVQESPAQ